MNLSHVLQITRAVAGYRDRKDLVVALTAALRQVVSADRYIVVIRRGRERDTFDAHFDPPAEISARVKDFSFLGRLREGRADRLTGADVEAHPFQRELWRRYDVKAALRIPLIVEGALVGTIGMWSSVPSAFDHIDLQVATELGKVVAVLVDSIRAYEHLAQLRDEAEEANSYLRDAVANVHHTDDGMVGQGPAFAAIKRQLEVVASTEATVLLTGESGTGKDVAARAIHAASKRRERPLVTINCAAIPNHLAETELFGHEEGAFTGASKARAGRFEQADGGTVFLDEIGELPLDVQAKLLRVLQERQFERVGGSEPIKIDVRIIAATNRDLQELIRADQFREDLYFRLAVFPIHLPPLRSRLDDLPALVDHFVKLAAERFRVAPRRVTPDVIRRLADHDWPGNVRELQHAIERAMIVSPGDALSIDTIVPPRIAPNSTGKGSDTLRGEYLSALESARWVIEGAEGAAARLGVHPNTLRHRLRRMGIARPAGR